ncbi:ATP-binding response regulator [Methylomonas albis]|uniref:Response regulator n=1 Tax=Methylomonas albis TaxID=1854563 RepID=A0ABR9D273_9GAMM|nr:response regulator [Methylomonas albis]MBD9357214.1 response regulator [Methylomonas albis]
MNQSARILLVEDEDIIAIIIRELLATEGFVVTVCTDGFAAWETLQHDQTGYDLVLLDRGLPKMDGMELLRLIKGDRALASIPVIIQTARSDKQSIQEGLSQGAYYYLTKPIQPEVLLAVINAALQQRRELQDMFDSVNRAERPLAFLYAADFRFRDLEQAKLLSHCLAQSCPEPERVIQGLQELMINAVEHGNLGISYAEKGELMLAGTWQDEIQRRLQLPEFNKRFVSVHFQRLPDKLVFTVQDQGEGFDWQDFLDFSLERVFDLHGRGIAMARLMSFDRLEYQGNGNTVSAVVNSASSLCGLDN